MGKINTRNSQTGINGDNANVRDIYLYNYASGDKPEASPEAMRTAYLNHLFCNSGILTLEGIDPKAATSCDSDSRLNLSAVYTALMTHETEDRMNGLQEMRIDERQRQSALEVLNRHQHVVLLGDPGSGKTTFVNFTAICMAGELLEKKNINLGLLTRPLPNDEDDEDEQERQTWDYGALLPVRVVLRDFAAQGMLEKKNASGLWEFIRNGLTGAELGDFAPHMRKELLEKGGILLLDGLDEVPEAENRRVHLRKTIEDFIRTFGKCRVLVTSRTYAYQKQDWRIPGLHEAVLAPFTSGQIREFIDRWHIHVAGLRHKSGDEAQGNAELLKRAVFRNERLKELAQRPLLLTLMASLHSWRGGSLPENREELYADTVDLLLDRWEGPKIVKDKDGKPSLSQPGLMEWLDTDRAQMRRMLNELAYNAHSGQPELTGTADISEDELVKGLWEICRNSKGNMAILMEFLSDRAGLLLPRGVKVYSFPHRTFQEYLAACYLTDCDYPDTIAELCKKEPVRWREVCLLAGAKAARGSSSTVWSLAEALCYREPDDSATDEADIWGALLAGQALAETVIPDKISPRNRTKLERIKKWLVRILEENLLPAVERVAAGNALSQIGDPRFDPENWYLPADADIGFVTVSEGLFLMGSKPEDIKTFKSDLPDDLSKDAIKKLNGLFDSEVRHSVFLSEYRIARYPVTVAQFRAFVEDSGFEPKDKDCLKGMDSHPVVRVSWDEATAYCRWLTEKLESQGEDCRINLPTEAQWEKAARGTEGLIYSWGDQAIDSDRTNYDDTVGTTSPVGCFPAGTSPYGALDMIGNVWEWCQDFCYWEKGNGIITDTYVDAIKDPLCKKGSFRVFRGGSWTLTAQGCRSARRIGGSPDCRYGSLGFRVVFPQVGRLEGCGVRKRKKQMKGPIRRKPFTTQEVNMDVTLIIEALAAGAASAAKNIASQAVKYAYSDLKTLIQKKFSDKKDAKGEMALAEYEGDPDTWEKPLSKSLSEIGADKVPDIVEAVELLRQALEAMPEGEKVLAKYNIRDCEVGNIGDNTTITGDIHIGGKK